MAERESQGQRESASRENGAPAMEVTEAIVHSLLEGSAYRFSMTARASGKFAGAGRKGCGPPLRLNGSVLPAASESWGSISGLVT